MKKIKSIIIVFGLIMFAALAFFLIHLANEKPQEAEEDTRPVVETVFPQIRDIYVYTEQIGTVEPKESIAVMPKAMGEVKELMVKEGDSVEEGQELCRISSDALTSLRIQVDSARINMNDAAVALNRTQELFNSGAVSQQVLDQAASAARSTRLAYESAQNQYNLQNGYTVVTSPISGIVESLNISLHDTVSLQTVAFVISGKEEDVLKFGISESVKNTIQSGDEFVFMYKNQEYQGKITEIDNKISQISGLFDTEALIEGDYDIPPGSKVKLILLKDKAKNAISIPLSSLYYANNLPFVYVLEGNKARKKDVEAGIYDESYIEIISGITEEDQLIASWSNELYDGAEVLLKNEENKGIQPDESSAEETGKDMK